MLYQTTRLHPECHKFHKGLQAKFKWFIGAFAGGSGGVLSYLQDLDFTQACNLILQPAQGMWA